MRQQAVVVVWKSLSVDQNDVYAGIAGHNAAIDNAKRSRHIRRGNFDQQCETSNSWHNRAFSASSSARLRGRSASAPVTRFERADCMMTRKKSLATEDRRNNTFLAHRVSWLNTTV
jgi:hypothetical protein